MKPSFIVIDRNNRPRGHNHRKTMDLHPSFIVVDSSDRPISNGLFKEERLAIFWARRHGYGSNTDLTARQATPAESINYVLRDTCWRCKGTAWASADRGTRIWICLVCNGQTYMGPPMDRIEYR